jgi:signal transduction histidine kinase
MSSTLRGCLCVVVVIDRDLAVTPGDEWRSEMLRPEVEAGRAAQGHTVVMPWLRAASLPARWFDAVVSLVITGVGMVEVWSSSPHPDSATRSAVVLLVGVALWWRRLAPLPVLLVTLAAGLVLPAVGAPAFPLYQTLALFVVAYSVAAYASLGVAAAGQLVFLVALWWITLASGGTRQDAAFGTVITVVLWVLGRMVRRLRERDALLGRATEQLAERQAEFAQVAVFAERARIARELHDVVAHSVNVMLVQAGGVRSVVDRGGQVPRDAMLAIESTGRRALDELDTLLGILRRPNDGAPGLAPPPQLGTLPELATEMSQAGLPTELIVEGEVRRMSETLELSAYRIVQEALTNALRHRKIAGPATVVVHYGETALNIEIRDHGRGDVDRQRPGRGQIGMRERAALFGGTIEMGPVDDGGYRVRANLPTGVA